MAVMWSMSLFKADAEKVYGELQTLENITPQNIVDYAKSDSTELHKCFEWDDSIAGNEYRKIQARNVVRLLVFKDDEVKKDSEEPVKIRVMQHVKSEYKPVSKIVTHKDEYKELLERAYAELRAFKQRYKTLTELEEILALIP